MSWYWIHSDPVSGSSQRTNKNGSPNERKEYEPLGNQLVNINGDENDYPLPPTQTEAMLRADDPVWMCQMEGDLGRSFEGHDLPTRCQTAQAQNGIEVQIKWGQENEVIHDSPMPQFVQPFTPSDTVLVFSRKATRKPDGEEKQDDEEPIIIKTSVPKKRTPAVPEIDMTSIPGVDASSSMDDETKKLKRSNALARSEEIIDNNNRCAEFLSTLIDLVEPDSGISTNNKVFNLDGTVSNNNPSSVKIRALRSLTNFRDAESENRVSSSNKSVRSGDSITYATTRNFSEVVFNNDFYEQSSDDAALTVLHESLHLYGGFNDQALAKAASMYGKNPNRDKPKVFEKTDDASEYLQGQLNDYCKPRKLSVGGTTTIKLS